MISNNKQLAKKLKVLFPKATILKRRAFAKLWAAKREEYNVSSAFQENALLAQIREEVGPDLKPKQENLNYSCKALTKIFGYFRRNKKDAYRYGRCNKHRANQPAIANRAYALRLGNGNVTSGDGWKFRGAGYIQLTGRSNYSIIKHIVEVKSEPGLSLEKFSKGMGSVHYATLSALGFYYANKLYLAKNVDEMTRKVNRHTDSYNKRRKHYLSIAFI